MQFLFKESEESPGEPGLGLLDGCCTGLRPSAAAKVPHVGWNTIEHIRPSRLLDGIPAGAAFYFTHSYAAPVTDACVARTTHASTFAAAVERGSIFGVQFHPEKSGVTGLRVLGNFVRCCVNA